MEAGYQTLYSLFVPHGDISTPGDCVQMLQPQFQVRQRQVSSPGDSPLYLEPQQFNAKIFDRYFRIILGGCWRPSRISIK